MHPLSKFSETLNFRENVLNCLVNNAKNILVVKTGLIFLMQISFLICSFDFGGGYVF